MNKERRKEIQSIINALEEIKERISAVNEEEQEAFDNMPESLQESKRGETMQEALDRLQTAEDEIENQIYELQEIIEA